MCTRAYTWYMHMCVQVQCTVKCVMYMYMYELLLCHIKFYFVWYLLLSYTRVYSYLSHPSLPLLLLVLKNLPSSTLSSPPFPFSLPPPFLLSPPSLTSFFSPFSLPRHTSPHLPGSVMTSQPACLRTGTTNVTALAALRGSSTPVVSCPLLKWPTGEEAAVAVVVVTVGLVSPSHLSMITNLLTFDPGD